MSWISDVRCELMALDVSPKKLRRFGVTVGIVLIALFMISRKGSGAISIGLGIVGVTLVVAGLALPRILRGAYRVWMGFALALGWIISRVILTILFYLVLTPIAFIARLAGKEFMDIRWDRKRNSYWIDRDGTKAIDYEKMH
jgi:hypothetical protein